MEWHIVNEKPYRFYRVNIAIGKPTVEAPFVPLLQFGHEGRKIITDYVSRLDTSIPLLRFVNEGLTDDKRYYIFSYFLPRSAGVDINTAPDQRFGYQYNLKW